MNILKTIKGTFINYHRLLFYYLIMWPIGQLQVDDPQLQQRLKNLKTFSFTIGETLELSIHQRFIAVLRYNKFSYNEIGKVTGISSHNTIAAVLQYTACGVPYRFEAGGSYTIFSRTLRQEISNIVTLRRKALNCMKTHEAKNLILENVEDIRKKAIQRLISWGCEGLIERTINFIDSCELTQDVFRNFCDKYGILILTPEKFELVRRKCCNHVVIDKFYSITSDLVAHYDPAYKFNADETGLASKRIFRILTDEKCRCRHTATYFCYVMF